LALSLSTARIRARDAERYAATIAPYVDDQTILVGHADASRIDVAAAAAMLSALLPTGSDAKRHIDQGARLAKAWLSGFQKAGGRDIYAALCVSDMGYRDTPDFPVYLVVPIAKGGTANAIRVAIPTSTEKNFPLQMVTRIPSDGPFVFGARVTLERLKARYTTRAVGEREVVSRLAEAFAAVDGSALQIVFTPTDDDRRVVREMFPKLPKPLDAVDGPTLADGLRWKAVGIGLPPAFTIRSVVHAKNVAAANRLAEAWKQLLDFAKAEPTIRQHVPMVGAIVPLLQPVVNGDNLVVTIKQDAVERMVKQVLLPAVTAARSATYARRRSNQFKRLGLAMHIWADTHGKSGAGKRRIHTFPPAAIHGKDGKPLLSWRVALLPYLGQQSLYDQFHLDEPWDSEHNKKLIDKMPDVLKDAELHSALRNQRLAPGFTTYVVPIGAGLVFGRKEGTAFREIKDGTSKTIMIVEVTPDRAVPWTKPADWDVAKITRDPKTFTIVSGDPLKGVRRSDRQGFTTTFCDGSVRTIGNDIDPSTFWKLLTRDGGEVVGPYRIGR